MESERIELIPTTIPEWNDPSDGFFDVLSGDNSTTIDDAAARALLDEVHIELPKALDWTALLDYAARQQITLEGVELAPDRAKYDYYLLTVPVTLMVPPGFKLVQLCLALDFAVMGDVPDDAVAYDLFPNPLTDTKTVMSGEASIDISRALQFVLALTGQVALVPAAKCFGLKIEVPFKWSSTTATLQSSARMSNPVRWWLKDTAIEHGFVPIVIVRVPKGEALTVKALLVGEVSRINAFGFKKSQFTSPQRSYRIG